MTSSTPPLELAVSRLSDDARRLSVDALVRAAASLAQPGLYLWWVDDVGADHLGAELDQPVAPGPIYGGQAGARTTRRESSATLGSRLIGNHVKGNVRGSTLRWTLAACLTRQLALEPLGGRHMAARSEADLSAWIREHLSVTTLDVVDRDSLGALETHVLAVLDPPLNLAKMDPSPARTRLSTLRSAFTLGGAVRRQFGRSPAAPRVQRDASAASAHGLTPNQLAAELGMPDGKQVRRFLRATFPRDDSAWHTRWGALSPEQEMAVRQRFGRR